MKHTFFLIALFIFAAQSSKAQTVFSVDYANQADVKVYVVKYEKLREIKTKVWKDSHEELVFNKVTNKLAND